MIRQKSDKCPIKIRKNKILTYRWISFSNLRFWLSKLSLEIESRDQFNPNDQMVIWSSGFVVNDS